MYLAYLTPNFSSLHKHDSDNSTNRQDRCVSFTVL